MHGTMMHGTMMHYPLTLAHSLERAGKFFSNTEIVSRRPDHALHRYTYADLYRRARALAEALQKAGLKRGDRVLWRKRFRERACNGAIEWRL